MEERRRLQTLKDDTTSYVYKNEPTWVCRLETWRCKRDIMRVANNDPAMLTLNWGARPHAWQDTALLAELGQALRANTHLQAIDLRLQGRAYGLLYSDSEVQSLDSLRGGLATSRVVSVEWDDKFHREQPESCPIQKLCYLNQIKRIEANERLPDSLCARGFLTGIWQTREPSGRNLDSNSRAIKALKWMDEDVLTQLAEVLPSNEHVTHVSLPFGNGNYYSAENLKELLLRRLIERVAENDPKLKEINLGVRHVDETVALSLVSALKTNTCVHTLTFDDLSSAQQAINKGKGVAYSGGHYLGETRGGMSCYSEGGVEYPNPLHPSDPKYQRPICPDLSRETMLALVETMPRTGIRELRVYGIDDDLCAKIARQTRAISRPRWYPVPAWQANAAYGRHNSWSRYSCSQWKYIHPYHPTITLEAYQDYAQPALQYVNSDRRQMLTRDFKPLYHNVWLPTLQAFQRLLLASLATDGLCSFSELVSFDLIELIESSFCCDRDYRDVHETARIAECLCPRSWGRLVRFDLEGDPTFRVPYRTIDISHGRKLETNRLHGTVEFAWHSGRW
eukprot:SAG25_NODE_485_length_7477_cov_6.546761_1_plen_565_part_00